MRLTRTRLVMALTAVMVVVWGNVALGSNGDPIRAGQDTTATSQTSLTTTQSANYGFLVTLNGATAGAAIKGVNNSTGTGITGIATSPNGFGNRSLNTAATHGLGAAAVFTGNRNDGVVATTNTNAAAAVVAKNPAAPGGGLPSTAVFASSPSSTGQAVLAVGGQAVSNPGSSPGTAFKTGVVGVGSGGGSAGFNEVGVAGLATNGITGVGSSVGVNGIANGPGALAGAFSGDVSIEGNLTITGSCTGCTIASVAANGGRVTLRRGDPVTIVGMRRSPVDGRPIMAVAPARAGRPAIGVVDRGVGVRRLSAGASIGTGKASRKVSVRGFRAGGESAAPGGYLSVITHGVGWGRVDATARGVAAGDELVAGAGGALVARGPVRVGDVVTPGSSIGFALQQASGKRLMAVFVSPH